MLRAFLYQASRYEAGCPKPGKDDEHGWCVLHEKVGAKVPCGVKARCPHLVVPIEEEPPAEFSPWLRRIFRVDAMRASGCTFRMNDLSPQDWTALIAIQQERGRMDMLVWDAKERVRDAERGTPDLTRDEERALADARKLSGAPPPGASLFGPPKKR